MGLAWALALEGTTQKAIKALCQKQDVDSSRILRTLKRGSSKVRGFTWKVSDEKGGKLRIFNVAHTKSKK